MPPGPTMDDEEGGKDEDGPQKKPEGRMRPPRDLGEDCLRVGGQLAWPRGQTLKGGRQKGGGGRRIRGIREVAGGLAHALDGLRCRFWETDGGIHGEGGRLRGRRN